MKLNSNRKSFFFVFLVAVQSSVLFLYPQLAVHRLLPVYMVCRSTGNLGRVWNLTLPMTGSFFSLSIFACPKLSLSSPSFPPPPPPFSSLPLPSPPPSFYPRMTIQLPLTEQVYSLFIYSFTIAHLFSFVLFCCPQLIIIFLSLEGLSPVKAYSALLWEFLSQSSNEREEVWQTHDFCLNGLACVRQVYLQKQL